MVRKNNHWCKICNAPIKKNPHHHCPKCQAPDSEIVTPHQCNRWGCNEIYIHTCSACKNTWEEIIS